MRVLLDECVPHVLRHHMPGHQVVTVTFMGWNGIKNGALLALMLANGFDVLLTVDKSMRYQQNLLASGVGVIQLLAASNDPTDLIPLMPAACTALAAIKPGDVVVIP